METITRQLETAKLDPAMAVEVHDHKKRQKLISKAAGKRVVMVATEGRLSIKRYHDGKLVDEWADIKLPVSKCIFPGVYDYMYHAMAWACDYNPPDFSKARERVRRKRQSWFRDLFQIKEAA